MNPRNRMAAALRLLSVLSVCLAATTAAFTLEAGTRPIAVVTQQNPSHKLKWAQEELVEHLQLATGVFPVTAAIGAPLPPGSFVFTLRSATAEEIAHKALGFYHAEISCDRDNYSIIGNDEGTSQGTRFAVYDFLDKRLGCRWLWPGELGRVVPKTRSIALESGVTRYRPALRLVCWRPCAGNRQLWDTPKGWEHFFSNQQRWFDRNRLFNDMRLQFYPHGFEDWWGRFQASHPEWFQMLPDGTRRPDKLYMSGAPRLVSLCVSNPEIARQVVQDWLANPNPIAPRINLCENDTAGRCTCDACLEADGSPVPAEIRRANARRRFESGDEAWFEELGSVTNRYAKFFMRVLEEVDRIAPERKAGIAGNIYANYSEPPSIRMSPRIQHRFCPPIMFPWSHSKINTFKRLWAEWRATGCELILRPNFTLDGHDYPINYAAEFSECLRFAHANGLVGLDMDSCTGQWPVMGTTLYTIARLTCDPAMSDEQILGEYYAAFGPAAPAVRAYFDETARISRRFADDLPREQNAGIVGGDYSKFKLHAHHVFTPEVFARLFAILEDAGRRAADTPLAAKRIAWLRNGLEHARLTAETARAFEEYTKTKDIRPFGEAQKRLDDFRAAHEMEFLANIGFLRHLENFDWPSRTATRMLMENNLKLPVEWQFQLDPQDVGMKERWFAYDHDASGWRKIRTDAPWEPQLGEPYDGYGWYRLELDMPEKIDGTPIIVFGAVDEACMVWCNGALVHRRPYPFQGDRDSWMEPFEVSLHNAVFPGRKNVIVVRVEDRSGAGGIWKPCHLKVK